MFTDLSVYSVMFGGGIKFFLLQEGTVALLERWKMDKLIIRKVLSLAINWWSVATLG